MIVTFDFDDTLQMANGEPNEEIVGKYREHLQNGDKVFIITSRPYSNQSYTEIKEFIRKNKLDVEDIYHTDGEPKLKTVLYSGAQLHYDDDPMERNPLEHNGVKTYDAWNQAAQKAWDEYMGRL